MSRRRSAVSRRSRVLSLGLLALAAACNRIDVAPAPGPPGRADGPHVVLVTIDTLRHDRVGAYGGPEAASTPTLDALAARGARVETVFAPTPLTLPSHTSILTGLEPPRHGVRHNGLFRLAEDVPTLAERFRDAGWATGAVIGAMVLAPSYGLDRGFDHYDADVTSHRAAATGYHERSARDVTDAALAWLGRRTGPFFLWVHYYDPHAAYEPPHEYASRYPDDPYAGEIAYTDAQLGRLIEALRVGGELDRTLVAVTSDHGESLGEHGEATHSYTVYDAALRVPLVIAGPGVPAGTRIDTVASNLDVGPTLLALAGLPPLDGVDGRDLSAAWREDGGLTPRPAYGETLATRIDHGWAPLHALRSDAHLYVRAPRPELYDVARDPDQLVNLLADATASTAPTAEAAPAPGPPAADSPPAPGPPAAASLSRELDRRLAVEGEAEAIDLDPETRAGLQALGYALPDAPVVETGLDPKDGLRFIGPFERAKSLYQGGEMAEARALVEPLLDRMPGSPGLHDLLARIHLSAGRVEAARTHAERALAINPRSSHYQVLLGLVHVAREAFDEAVAAFERARELDPDDANAAAGGMWRLAAGGSLAEADAAARDAVALQPRSAELRVLIGDNWDRLGRYERALEAYREAVALDPGNPAAHLGLAIQTARLGDVREVEGHLARAGAAGAIPGARLRLAVALAARGDLGRAESLLRGLVAEHPGFRPARKVLARVLEEAGRPDEATALRAGPAGTGS